jgi:hypothetical protein
MGIALLQDEREHVRLYPKNVRFISGISSAYDDDFPVELKDIVSKSERGGSSPTS